MTAGGQLRVAEWRTDPARPAEPAHAYAATDGRIPFRGLCGEGRWTVKSPLAEAGPLCPVCREVVRGAANRLLDEVADLEATAAGRAADAMLARDRADNSSAYWHEVLDR